MQKFLGIITLIFAGLFVSTNNSYADELFVDTSPIPEQLQNYVSNEWQGLTHSQTLQNNEKITDYYLGTPFSITNNNFIFPIIHNNTHDISYTIEGAITSDNQPTISISKKKAVALNKLSQTLDTKSNSPVEIVSNSTSFGYIQNNNYKEILSSPLENRSLNPITTENNNTVINIVNPTQLPTQFMKKNSIPEFTSKQLPWVVYETQSILAICYSYCLTSVINNQLGKEVLTAENLVKIIDPTLTDLELRDGSKTSKLLVSQYLTYLDSTYNQNIKFETNILPFDTLKNEIDNNSAVIYDLKNITQNDGMHDHASVILGYTMTKNEDNENYPPYYTYWNPWWEETFVVSSQLQTLTYSTMQFTPFRATYNFRVQS